MESNIQELLSEQCERPRHLQIDRWVNRDSPVSDVHLWGTPSDHQLLDVKRRKYARRFEKWFNKLAETDPPISVPSEKLAEAKRRHFTPEDKHERIARSLAALHQPPRIQLTREEWRRIVEDQDLEDQF